MRLLKAVVFYLFICLLLWALILNLKQLASYNHWVEFSEQLLIILLCIPLYSRAFIIDKAIRQHKNQEVVPFYLFLFDTTIIRLFSMLLIVKPYYKAIPGPLEKVRKKINLLTYTVYF